MKVRHYALVSDVRMTLGDDGELYATQEMGGYRHWLPYVNIAGRVTVMARHVEDGKKVSRADGPGVDGQGLKNYNGLAEFVKSLPRLVQQLWRGAAGVELYVVRLPEPLSILTAARCIMRRQPYVALVVADVRGWATAGLPKAAGIFMTRPLVWTVCVLVRRAAGSIYVTERILQRTYRPALGRPTLARSNVMLDSSVAGSGRLVYPSSRNLVAIGSQQSDDKGHDVAIRAMVELVRLDRRYHLTLLGAGRTQIALRNLASKLGVSESVTFRGYVSEPSDVRLALMNSDLMVVPSRTDGLPRALIEGMATGLPAVASEVGGIPELLPQRCLIPVDDAFALAAAVHDIFSQPACWLELSSDNYRRAAVVREATNPEHLREFFAQVHAQLEGGT